MRRWYGSSPLHLVTVLAALALAGVAVVPLVQSDRAVQIGLWFLGAVLVHDLVLFPLYALADRALYKGKEAGRNRGFIVEGVDGADLAGASRAGEERGLQLHLVLPDSHWQPA